VHNLTGPKVCVRAAASRCVGHHQTHLGWAKGQSGEAKKKKRSRQYFCTAGLQEQPRVNIMLGPLVAGVFFFTYLAELAIIYNTV